MIECNNLNLGDIEDFERSLHRRPKGTLKERVVMLTLKEKKGEKGMRMRRQRRVNAKKRRNHALMLRRLAEEEAWEQLAKDFERCADLRIEMVLPAMAMVNSPSQVAQKIDEVMSEAERSSRLYRDCDESPLSIQSPQLKMALVGRQPRFPWLRSCAYWLRRLFTGRV